MLHEFVIRPMTPDDIPEVSRWVAAVPLWQRYQVRALHLVAQFAAALERGHILLAADRGAQDVGCGFVWCAPQGAFGRSAYLRLLGVKPGLEGMGIGAALLGEAERRAASVSREMFLLVSDFNVAAQRFYQRHDYRQVGAIPGYVLPDVAELIFWKRLDPAAP